MTTTLPLIIFDCDGVLVDTEAVANHHIAAIFSAMGWKLSGHDSRALFQGKSMDDVARIASAKVGFTLSGDSLQQQLIERLANGVNAITAVEDTVEGLINSGYPVCVASSGSIEKMHTTLAQTRLLPLLKSRLFSTSMVKHGKPAPDIFLHAAAAMGHAIADCCIVEDSPSGVQAGVAAGATVFGYSADPFISADQLQQLGAITFDDMRLLPELICQHCQ